MKKIIKHKPAYGDKTIRINAGYTSYYNESGRFANGWATVCTYIYRDGVLVNYEHFL